MKKLIVLSAVFVIFCSGFVFASDTENTKTVPMGEHIPDMSFTTLSGEHFDTAEILQEKQAILINFFRVSCPFCIEEFPILEHLQEIYGDQVAFLALDSSLYDSAEEVEELQDEYQITLDIALEGTWTLSKIIPYDGYPCTIVLDKNGDLVFYQDYSFEDETELAETFDCLLAEDYKSGYRKMNSYEDLLDEPDETEDQPVKEQNPENNMVQNGYQIVVSDQNKDPVEGVMINFCSEAQGTCRMDETKSDGTVFFEVPEDVYHIAILAVPSGYSYDQDVEMYTDNHYEFPINISIVRD